MEPSAGSPFGLSAVPERVAVSLIEPPIVTGPAVALVLIVGCLGVTVLFSPVSPQLVLAGLVLPPSAMSPL